MERAIRHAFGGHIDRNLMEEKIVKLSKTSTLAALAVVHLASRQGDGFIQARQVAEYLHIPTDSALKVLQALARRGVIASQLGRAGGYRLDADPTHVSLLQIVEAVDGPVETEIPLDVVDERLFQPITQLRKACNRISNAMRTELENTTISELAELFAGQVLATIEAGVAH